MDALTDEVGAVLDGIVNHPLTQLVLAAFVVYVVVLWLAASFWVLNDMRRRTTSAAMPYLAAGGILVSSPVLFPAALVVYRIVRPGETMAEARERELNDRIEEAEADAALACPGCGRSVRDDWLVCPACRTRLAHRCTNCGRTIGLDWTLCAWCGTEFGRTILPEAMPRAARGSTRQAGPPGRRPGAARVLEPGA